MRNIREVCPIPSASGQPFQPIAEKELRGLAIAAAGTLPGPTGSVVLVPEMVSPLGRPDFVALLGGEHWLQGRIASSVSPILSELDCLVVSMLHTRRALSVDSIASKIEWSPNAVEKTLLSLCKLGAVERSLTNTFYVNPVIKPNGTLIALEMKVRDWPRAVAQGRTYRTWADNYVVILGDVGKLACDRAQSRIIADGGGLYTDRGWLSKPVSRKAGKARRQHGFEMLFAALLSDPAFRSPK